jgi:hypothetical protein
MFGEMREIEPEGRNLVLMALAYCSARSSKNSEAGKTPVTSR